MCGILGYVTHAPARDDARAAAVVRMRDALAHRGPDGWGLVRLEGDRIEEDGSGRPAARRPRTPPAPWAAALGHQRLAVIDLTDGGRQPRATPDGRFWITYNGEIYNYRELRVELESGGARFTSESDTEVLLALYARDGAACLDRLRGMFAFAVWDDREGVLFLARDRFGMKPLCYASPSAGAIAFASEPKALLAAGLASRQPAEGSAARFLRRGSLPADASWYADVRVVAPGGWARWTRDGIATGRYWSLDESSDGPPRPVPAESAAAAVRRALVASVRAHLVADVPVGVFLSGGLDSAALLAAAREVSNGPLRTFTVVLPGTPHDEGALARQAAERFGTEHVEIAVSGDRFLEQLGRFFDAMDEPTVDGANTYLVAQAARSAGLSVALSGLGGDELLGGYGSFVAVPRLGRLIAALGSVPGGRAAAAWFAGRLPTRGAPKMAELLGRTPPRLDEVWRAYRALFTHAQVGVLAGAEAPAPGAAPGRADRDPFWTVSRCEIEEFMEPQLLRDADAFTMAWGLELRTPFVDHELLAAVRAAGRWARAGGASYKATLFRRMSGFLPEGHLGVPKRSFVLPIERWLRRALADPSVRDATLESVLAEPRCRPIVERFARGRLHWSRVWALYVLERFARRGTGEGAARP
jgi:asparagine synthase (glutamine-hydrolysing)